MTALTETDRQRLDRARELATLRGAAAIREHTGDSDPLGSYVAAFGEAQEVLTDLVTLVYRLNETR